MLLSDVARILYNPETCEKDIPIIVETTEGRIIWQGRAEDLKTMPEIKHWMVLSVVPLEGPTDTPLYNRGKRITVF